MKYIFYEDLVFVYTKNAEISEEKIKQFEKRVYDLFLKQCNDKDGNLLMTKAKNSEWIFRTYSAAKMTLASTLLINSAEYAVEKNIMVSVPYLQYYALFTACRALLFASPHTKLEIEKLVEISHTKLIKEVSKIIKEQLDKTAGEKIEKALILLKNQRELFSYKFPLAGIIKEIPIEETINCCGLILELAEIASNSIQKVFENKILNKDKKTQGYEIADWMFLDNSFRDRMIKYSFKASIKDGEVFDNWIDIEDAYRVNYIERKVKIPYSILNTITEGMTEDFFGAWCSKNNEDDVFNPDINWGRLLPIR